MTATLLPPHVPLIVIAPCGLSCTSPLFSNDTENRSGKSALRIVERSRHAVVVTQGAEGVLVVDADLAARRLPAAPVAVKDTTGAGDTFNGVLAARLAAGDDLAAAVPIAVAAASLSVGEVGARGGMPTMAAVTAAMR